MSPNAAACLEAVDLLHPLDRVRVCEHLAEEYLAENSVLERYPVEELIAELEFRARTGDGRLVEEFARAILKRAVDFPKEANDN